MKCGPKGESHLCGACGSWHSAHMPDNCTEVPICPKCWKESPISTRVFAITCARMATRVESLDNTIFQGIEGAIVDLVQAKARKLSEHNCN